MCQFESEVDDCARLGLLHGGFDDTGVGTEVEDNLTGGTFGEEVSVDFGGGWEGEKFRVLSLDGGKSSVLVLEVRADVTLEGEHPLPVECVVVDSRSQMLRFILG